MSDRGRFSWPIVGLGLVIVAICVVAAWRIMGAIEEESPTQQPPHARGASPNVPEPAAKPSPRVRARKCATAEWTTLDGEPADSIVLITIDTLRRDHLKTYGYRLDTTPFLTRLAAESVVFEQAISSSSHTAPAHASIFTGRPPSDHRMLTNGAGIRTDAMTMACAARAAGMKTAAFTSVPFLKGASAGFDHFIEAPTDGGAYASAEAVEKVAKEFLQQQAPDDRYFVWIHFFDVHEWKHEDDALTEHRETIVAARGPVEDHHDYIRKLHALSDGPTWGKYLDPQLDKSVDFVADTPEKVIDFIDTYDAQILRVDRAIESLHKVAGKRKGSLWIITADHGEGLGSHGKHGHGIFLYDEQLHIPLIVAGSALADDARGRRVDAQVRHIDLLPTVLAALKREGPSLRGSDIGPLWRGGTEESVRIAFAERRPVSPKRLVNGWSNEEMYALRRGSAKLIYHSRSPHEYYDLTHDPQELDNILRRDPSVEDAALMSTAVERRLARLKGRSAKEPEEEMTPEMLQKLRALGYVE